MFSSGVLCSDFASQNPINPFHPFSFMMTFKAASNMLRISTERPRSCCRKGGNHPTLECRPLIPNSSVLYWYGRGSWCFSLQSSPWSHQNNTLNNDHAWDFPVCHAIVEHFMIAANLAAGEVFDDSDVEAIYRVQNKPQSVGASSCHIMSLLLDLFHTRRKVKRFLRSTKSWYTETT